MVGKAPSFSTLPSSLFFLLGRQVPGADTMILQDTVLTCFPGEFTHSGTLKDLNDSPTDISASILRYISDGAKRSWIRNAEELAYCIVDRCAGNVFDVELQSKKELDFMDIFHRSIADVVSPSISFPLG